MSKDLKKAEKFVRKYMKKIGYSENINSTQHYEQSWAEASGVDPLTGSTHDFTYGWGSDHIVTGISYSYNFKGEDSGNEWMNVTVALEGKKKKEFKKFLKSFYKPKNIDLMNEAKGSDFLWDSSDSYALATVIDNFPGVDHEYDPINGSTKVKIGLYGSWIGASERGLSLSTLG